MSEALDKILKARGLTTTQEYDKIMNSQEFIPTGYPDLDILIQSDGLGGIPRSKITEIAGAFASGKSRFVKDICLRPDLKALYIDAENSLPTPEYNHLRQHCDIMFENQLENIWGVVNDALGQELYDIIVIDSLASCVTQAERDDDNSISMNASLGKAKLMSAWIRKMIPLLTGSGTAVVFVNHLATEIGTRYTNYTTPGGSAVKYYSNLRLYFKSLKGGYDAKNSTQGIEVTLEKSKSSPKGTKCNIVLNLVPPT